MTSEPFNPAELEARIAAIRKLADDLGKVPVNRRQQLSEAERLAEELQEQAAALRSKIRRTTI